MKGISKEQAIKKARQILETQDSYLLLLDVQNSSKHPDRIELQNQLRRIKDNLNKKFPHYLPENSLEVLCETHKGFRIVCGDALIAGVNSEKAIPEIENYLSQYPIVFQYQVAKDGYSPEIDFIK